MNEFISAIIDGSWSFFSIPFPGTTIQIKTIMLALFFGILGLRVTLSIIGGSIGTIGASTNAIYRAGGNSKAHFISKERSNDQL